MRSEGEDHRKKGTEHAEKNRDVPEDVGEGGGEEGVRVDAGGSGGGGGDVNERGGRLENGRRSTI